MLEEDSRPAYLTAVAASKTRTTINTTTVRTLKVSHRSKTKMSRAGRQQQARAGKRSDGGDDNHHFIVFFELDMV